MLHCCLLHSEETDRRSTLDRSVLVCRRKSWEKNLARTQPHACVPSPKIRRNKLRKSIRLRVYFRSRALGPVLFTRNTRKTPKINFPDLPNGCGPRMRATSSAYMLKTKQISNLFDTLGWEGWVGLFGLFPTYRRSPYRCRSLPSFLPCFSTHHYQHVSGSSGVHLSLFRPILKFESF